MNDSSQIYDYFMNYLQNAYSTLCMVDYPYATSFLANLPAWPVSYSCWSFTGLSINSSDQDIINAMVKSAKIYYDYDNVTKCTDIFQNYYTNPNTTGIHSLTMLIYF